MQSIVIFYEQMEFPSYFHLACGELGVDVGHSRRADKAEGTQLLQLLPALRQNRQLRLSRHEHESESGVGAEGRNVGPTDAALGPITSY